MKTGILAVLCAAAAAVAQPAASRADLVVTPSWLAGHLRDADMVVLQVGEKKTYDGGHVPGARFVNVSTDLAASDSDGKGLALEMLPIGTLRERLASLGIGDTSRVVVVQSDDWWSPSARLMFTLDYAGLGRTAWLDGGLTAWKAAGYPVATDVPAAPKVTLSPLKAQPIVVDADFVRAHAHAAGYALADARATGFYDGSQAGGPRNGPRKAGHILTARSSRMTCT
jgi:thiosulfate/3-mercaptopyruvate sulfurtransferase